MLADKICDGTNDEVQIQEAVDELTAIGGGEVILREGDFHVGSSPIALKSNVTIRGAGINATYIYGDATLGTNAVMLSTAPDKDNPIHDVTLSDFTIDGSSMPLEPAATFRKGIDALFTLRWTLENIRIANTPATGYGMDCNVQMRITNCIADNCGVSDSNPGYNGFGIGTGFYAEESVQMTNCMAINCLNNGFLLEYVGGGFNSRHYQLTNCYAYGNKRGFRVSGASGATFTNCKAIANTFNGFFIQLFGAAGATPEETKVIGCDALDNGDDGIYFKDQEYGQTNIICEGNHSYSNAGDGIVCGGRYAQIKNNVCWANDNDGIFYHVNSATATGDVQITGNICYNNGLAEVDGRSDGIRVHGELGAVSSVIVSGNQCFDDQVVSTITDGAMSSVTNPTRLTSAAGGWQTTDVGKPITVVGAGAAGADLTTTIAGYLSATVAILADPALTTVVDATATYGTDPTQQFGITVKDYASNVIVANNICHDNMKSGIFYQITVATTALNAHITDNICYNNGRSEVATATDGIRVWGSSSGSIEGVLVQGNRCYDVQGSPTQDYGIAMKDNVTEAMVLDNDLRGNKTAPVLNDVTSDATIYYANNRGVADIVTKTANYTLTSLDKTVLADTTSGDKTMTLPTAVGRLGRRFTVKKIVSANVLTIATTSSQTIDGSTTAAVSVQYLSLTLESDNANWHIV